MSDDKRKRVDVDLEGDDDDDDEEFIVGDDDEGSGGSDDSSEGSSDGSGDGDDGSDGSDNDDDDDDDGSDDLGESVPTKSGKKRRREKAESESDSGAGSSDSDDSLASDTYETIDASAIISAEIPSGGSGGRPLTRSALRKAKVEAFRPAKKPRKDGEESDEAELSDL